MSPSGRFLAHVLPLQRQLGAYARRLLRDPSQVEDVLQTSLATAWARFDVYAEGTNFRAWIFRIVTLEVFNLNRRHEEVSLLEVPQEEAGDLEDQWHLETAYSELLANQDSVLEHLDAVWVRALMRLAAPERSVLLLRGIPEFSYREIAQVLGIPVGSVMGYLSRARSRLRRELLEQPEVRSWLSRRNPHEMQ